FIGIGVQSHRAAIRASEAPPSIVDGNGYLLGKKNAPVTVDVYEDFICPACEQFETHDKATVAGMIKDGTAKFRYIPLGYLDRFSTTRYSSRAANAAACMPSVAAFKKFHDLLYANQPEENSAGLTDQKLISYGKQAGADEATMTSCVNSEQYKGWVAKITDDASKDNVTHTPTIRIGGKEIQNSQGGIPGPDDLKKAVAAAKSAAEKAK
ncbi:MAG TPA: thioredoxin domain-containing protein, partial [Mycobacteriales bacterium]|nr:thioredoxin domain-containing protein [Mycobacteriales bacterium]